MTFASFFVLSCRYSPYRLAGHDVVSWFWWFPVFSPHQSAFVLALRAAAALTILWHHFSIYAPLSEWAAPLLGDVLDWLGRYARATQVFFVVGGYVAARTLSHRHWTLPELGRFALQRYCRLGLPYLAVIVLVLPIIAFARGWVPADVLGGDITWPQLLAHVFLLQDVLGYESLSAGLWFVCINFQLSLAYAVGLALLQRHGAAGERLFLTVSWLTALLSLFIFNLDPFWEASALFFFPYFFMGVLVQRALVSGRQWPLVVFHLVMVVATLYEWRWRLVIAMLFGAVLFVAERAGLGQRWPRSRWVARLGELSFSLFLIHFPVLLLVGAIWVRLGWSEPEAAVAGLLVAFVLSLQGAALFHRYVELPAAALSRRFRRSRSMPERADETSERKRRLAFES